MLSGLSYRFEAAANSEIISPEEYRKLIRGLNSKQRAMVMYHREWCKRAVQALKSGEQIEPYRVFLSGPGGVGKSHVIKLIQSDTIKFGVAAFNVNGMTLHLGRSKYSGFQPLSNNRSEHIESKAIQTDVAHHR